jgi:hypothetical protein
MSEVELNIGKFLYPLSVCNASERAPQTAAS